MNEDFIKNNSVLPQNNTYLYTREEVCVWNTLLTQQLPLVETVAPIEYLDGLEKIDLPFDRIPSIQEISDKLLNINNWLLYPVDEIVTSQEFFNRLSQRQFPVIRAIRKKEEIDFYTNKSPDIFHEYFGHCPMLAITKYAECMRLMGQYAKDCDDVSLKILAKIFWITFEFGLIKSNENISIYGAGILPSRRELLRIKSKSIIIKELDIFGDLSAITLEGNIAQPIYYYVKSIDHLIDIVVNDIPNFIQEHKARSYFVSLAK